MSVISSSAVGIIAAEAAAGILLPVLIVLVRKAKTKAKLAPALIGAGTYIVFGLVLATFMNSAIMDIGGVSDFFAGHTAAYAVYGGLISALFEEGGRFASFRYILLGKFDQRRDAVSYGIGQGGFECVVTLGLTSLFYLLLALSVNSGVPQEQLIASLGGDAASLDAVLAFLNSVNAATLISAVFERAAILLANVGLSVLMQKAVQTKQTVLAAACVLIHIVLYSAVMLMANAENLMLCEALLLAVTAAAVFALLRSGAKSSPLQS